VGYPHQLFRQPNRLSGTILILGIYKMKANFTRHYLTAAMVAALCVGTLNGASTEPANSTPQEVFDGMRKSFQAEKAKGVHARYQWQLSGPNGGEWWIDVNDGMFKMGKGKIDTPNVTFSVVEMWKCGNGKCGNVEMGSHLYI
jgi:hypothetical protein